MRDGKQAVAVAYSYDGIHFEKYDGNPVIESFPPDGSPDFRDPAVCYADGKYWCVMASGNREKQTALLLLYESDDLLLWRYHGIMREWQNAKFAECPSFVKLKDKYLLAASVCREDSHSFSLAVGSFKNGNFILETEGVTDRGPDRYAGQIFQDEKGRAILISWVPGWDYAGYREQDIGCMSLPCEITYQNNKLRARPLSEVQALLADDDSAIIRTADGFCIARAGREDVVYKGKITSLKCLRDNGILEVFVNDGEEIYTALL